MKRPSAVTVFVLAASIIGIGVGIHDFNRIGILRHSHQTLEIRAQALGIPSVSGESQNASRIRRQEGEEAMRNALGSIAAALVLPPEAKDWLNTEPQWLALAAPLAELNPSQLKLFITEVSEAIGKGGLPILQRLASTAFILLAEADPASALAFFSAHTAVLKPAIWTMLPLSKAVSSLAAQDPVGALEWIRKNSNGRSSSAFRDAELALLRHLAAHDPAMAFEACRSFGLPGDARTLIRLFHNSIDPAKQEAMLVEFRNHVRIQDDEVRARLSKELLPLLCRALSEDTFESSADWREALSPEEVEEFVAGLSHARVREPEEWIGWLAEAPISQKSRDGTVQSLMDGWIRHNAVAAGNWLAQAPDNAAKAPAVAAYVAAIAPLEPLEPLEPQTAVQWALTLPAGEGRHAAMRSIYRRWPANDPAGKAAFAKEHRIFAN